MNNQKQSEHIVALNWGQVEGEALGSIDMLDGKTGKNYSLGIFDGGSKDDLYVCPLNPIIDEEERDVVYLDNLVSRHVFQRIQENYANLTNDSMILHEDDLLIDKEELVRDERFADWKVRLEKGDDTFSQSELKAYQEMRELEYPKIPEIESVFSKKESDISLDAAEKIVSNYVKNLNSDNPLIESKTDNTMKSQYQLTSVDKDHDFNTLQMKYLDRSNPGFSSKNFTYNQHTGSVIESDTEIIRDKDGMFSPQVTFINETNIKDLNSKVNNLNNLKQNENNHSRVVHQETLER